MPTRYNTPTEISSSSWTAVSAGGAFSLAINSNNYLYTWGSNALGQLNKETLANASPKFVPTYYIDDDRKWRQVSITQDHVLALRQDGTMFAWGRGVNGQLGQGNSLAYTSPVRIGTSSWTAISAGDQFSSAIRLDGILYTWGNNNNGRLGTNSTLNQSSPVPVGADFYLRLFGENAEYTNFAIGVDGRLYAWGLNNGTFGNGSTANTSSPVPIGTSSWTLVSSSGNHTLAIRSDGRLFTWGNNQLGQLGLNDQISRSSPVQLDTSLWTNVVAGQELSLAVRSDGTLWSWGANRDGQLGLGIFANKSSPVPIGTDSWKSVSSRYRHSAAIRNDDSLWLWGDNSGRLGLNDTNFRQSPVRLGSDSWKIVAPGRTHTAAIRSDDRLFTWGANFEGQLGDNTTTNRSSPVPIGTSSWIAVSALETTFAIRSDGALFSWGPNNDGQLGDNTTTNRSSPVQIGTSSWTAITAGGGERNSLAIRSDGALFSWGNGFGGTLGLSDIIDRSSPVQIGSSSWIAVSSDGFVTAAIRSDGRLFTWGLNQYGLLGDDSTSGKSSPVSIGTSSWIAVSVFTDAVFAVRSDGRLFAWGQAGYGYLGEEVKIHRSSPVQIGTSSWIAVSTGRAIRSDGALYVWGDNAVGQLGDSTAWQESPVQIGAEAGWLRVYSSTASNEPTLAAIRQSGSLFTWGNNRRGSLGNLSIENSASPVKIGSSSWTAVAIRNGSVIALRSDRLMFAWGYNDGNLGLNDITNRSSPVQIGTSTWSAITSGKALRSDNILFAWGQNDNGQVGDGTVINRSSPVQIGLNSWISIASTGTTTFAIRYDQTLWIWGSNVFGHLGLSDNVYRSSPVQLGTVSSWRSIEAGVNHMLALRFDRRLFAWGGNTNGELGLNDIAHRSSPTQVGTSSWTVISAGQSLSTAIDINSKLYTWGNNSAGQIGDNTILHRSSPVQIGVVNWLTVSAGSSHVAAVTFDRRLFTWGFNFYNQLGNAGSARRSSPVQISTQYAEKSWRVISHASDHTLAIDWDYRLWAWGLNDGRLGNNQTATAQSPIPVSTVSWRSISIGDFHTAGIRSDGTLFTWGRGDLGQLGNVTTTPSQSPIQIGFSRWSAVSVGDLHTAAIREDAALFFWGSNSIGQLGDNTILHRSSPVQLGTSSWITVGIDSVFSTAVRADGQLFTWGSGSSSRIGDGTSINRSSPVQIGLPPDTLYSWAQVDIGPQHTLAIRSDGALFSWGGNFSGQLGQNLGLRTSTSPVPIGTDSWTAVSIGGENYIYGASAAGIKANGRLFTWGDNDYGQLGTLDLARRRSPTQVGNEAWLAVSQGRRVTAAIRSDYKLFAWGDNRVGDLGINDTINRSSPVQVGTSSWVAVACSPADELTGNLNVQHAMLAIRSDGALFGWGCNAFGFVGDNTTIHRSSPVQVGTSSWTAVALSEYSAFALRSDGTLWGWGYSGYTGHNDNIDRSSPTQIGTSSWITVGTGRGGSTGAVRIDGTLWVWGSNFFSGIYRESASNPLNSPSQIGTATDWYRVEGVDNFSGIYARKTNGSLWMWGNYSDPFPTSSFGSGYSSPVQIGTSSWIAMAAGGYSGAAIRSDGRLFTWGNSSSGVLGFDDLLESQSPLQIGTSSWIAVSILGATSYAIRTDGALFAWGNNGYNTVGDNTRTNRSSPVQIGTSSWVAVSGSRAIRSDRRLFSWGRGDYGSIGDGTTVHRYSPVPIGTDSWTLVSSNEETVTMAIRNDGALFIWGLNNVGQLGDDTIISKSSPVQIGTSSWTGVGPAIYHSAAIRSDGALFTWGQNANGVLGLNDNFSRSSPVQIGTSSWTAVARGERFFNGVYDGASIAIRADGTLWGWGIAGNGGGLTSTVSSPVLIGTGPFISIAKEYYSSAAVDQNGRIWTWGNNDYLQLGVWDRLSKTIPTLAAATGWRSVFAGTSHVVGIADNGEIYTWGSNFQGQLGNGLDYARPEPVIAPFTWNSVYARDGVVGAIRNDGRMFTWGINNYYGQLGIGASFSHRSSPTQVGTSSWIAVYTVSQNGAAIRSDRSLWVWGDNSYGALARDSGFGNSTNSPVKVGTNESYTAVGLGNNLVVAVRSNNTLWTWGINKRGDGGRGRFGSRSDSPVQISTSSWVFAEAGFLNNAAILSNNTLFAWGQNVWYAFSGSGTNNKNSPTLINSSEWTAVNIRYSHGVGIRSNGTMWSWGWNFQGMLGQNTQTQSASGGLLQIGTSSWTAVSASDSHNLAIRSDGALFSWGSNSFGQLGDDTLIHRSSPVQIGTSSWVAVHGRGDTASFAIRSDGALFAWGSNTGGRLGTNDGISISSPVQIGTDSWTAVKGESTIIAIRSDGALFTWGDNRFGAIGDNTLIHRSSPVQIGTSSWTAVDANPSSATAIRSDGTMWSWGNAFYTGLGTTVGNISSPVQLGTGSWISISVGQDHSLAIDSTYKLYAWGNNDSGQLGDTFAWADSPNQIGSGADWRSVYMGTVAPPGSTPQEAYNSVYAIKTNGTLWAWGWNGIGQLGDNTTDSKNSPIQIGSSSWTLVSAGSDENGLTPVLAIRTDGALFAWGYNNSGQLGDNTLIHRSSPVQIGTSSWIAIGVGFKTAGAIRSDGTLWVWGSNEIGQLGLGDIVHRSSPVQLGTLNNWRSLSVSGQDFGELLGAFYAVNNKGEIYVWGENTSTFSWPGGLLGLNDTLNRSSPVQLGLYSSDNRLPAVRSFIAVQAGNLHSLALRNDRLLFAWGNNSHGQLGLAYYPNTNQSSPTLVRAPNWSWVSISNSNIHTMAIRSDGALFTWGEQGSYGLLGNSSTIDQSIPIQIGTSSWIVASASNYNSFAIRADYRLFGWGYGSMGQLGQNSLVSSSSPVSIGTSSWTAVTSSESRDFGSSIVTSYALALRTDGALFAWGGNAFGELGLSDIAHRSSPVQIGTTSWSAISANFIKSYAIRTDGALFAWGRNEFGQLGSNDQVTRSSPVQIGTSSWTRISAGVSHTAAIRQGGTLFTWGIDHWGELGLNTSGDKDSPVQIGSQSWKTVASAFSYTLAIRSDGTLWAWGSNQTGRLGLNSLSTGFYTSPVQVGTSSWTAVATVNLCSLAIRTDGALFTWGDNTYGQLGLNDLVHRSSPVQVGTSSWTAISAGFSVVAAIRSDGALFTWGEDSSGSLGNNLNGSRRSSPVQIGTSSWIAVAARSDVMAAIRSDNMLFTWGFGFWSGIGDGTTVNKSSPIQIGTSSWTAVSIDTFHNLALRVDGGLFVWGINANNFTSVGANSGSPMQLGTSSWTAIHAGFRSTFAIRIDGALYSSGDQLTGITGRPRQYISGNYTLENVGFLSWTAVNSIGGAFAIAPNGTLWAWGPNDFGLLGTGDSIYPSPMQVGSRSWNFVDTGNQISAGITSDGSLWTWGNNKWGQDEAGSSTNGHGRLGHNNTIDASSPTQVGRKSWKSVSTETANVIALDSNNILFAWGNRRWKTGEGVDTWPPQRSPVNVNTLSLANSNFITRSWSAISSRGDHNLAIDMTSKLYAWGRNQYGQLGLNSTDSQNSTTQIGSSSWTQVFTGGETSMAIRSDGTLFSWGRNDYAQYGDNRTWITSPIKIGTSSWTTVHAGDFGDVAIRRDGMLFTWGPNDFGQIGDRSLDYKSSPVQIGTSSWTAIAGSISKYAIRLDGLLFYWGSSIIDSFGSIITSPVQLGNNVWRSISVSSISPHALAVSGENFGLYAWGYGTQGRLGLGNITNQFSPVQVGTSSWNAVSAGDSHSVATRSDGRLFTWGNNSFGQLGDATVTNKSSPVPIGTNSWVAIEASSNNPYTLAINSFYNLFAWGDNRNGQLGDNTIVSKSSPVQIGTPSLTIGSAAEIVAITRSLTDPALFSSSSTTPTSGTNDNGFWTLSLPFNVTYLGTIYTQVFISTNSAITFDSGQTTSTWSAGSPVVNKILIQATDNSAQRIYSGSFGLSPNRTFRVRFEGTAATTGTLGSPNMIWEAVFYENRNDRIDIVFGNNSRSGQPSGVYSLTALLQSFTSTANNSVRIFTSNAQEFSVRGNSFTSVSAGGNTTSAFTPNNELFVWGGNGAGELGLNDLNDRSSPVQLGAQPVLWQKVFSGPNNTFAISSIKKLFAWGDNEAGELGTGNNINVNFPKPVHESRNWHSVAPGPNSTSGVEAPE